MILIKGGRLINPQSDFDGKADIELDGLRINKVYVGEEATGEYDEVIDACGLVVAPGLIDVHVHFRDPGQTEKEDLVTGSQAAAAGGFTSVVCMANTIPAVDSEEVLEDIKNRSKSLDIRIYQASTVTRGMMGEELVDMDTMWRAGAAGFTDDGKPILSVEVLKAAMEKAAKLDAVISLHEEDPAYVETAGVNMGKISELFADAGVRGASRTAEDLMVARDAMIALDTGARVDFQHLSSKNSIALIRLAKELGADVWGEASPHHFSLTEDAVVEHGANAKMNPPLRTEVDRMAIIEGLKDGTIRLIATDHAPHTEEQKSHGLVKSMSGIVGLETALALGITNLVEPGHLSLMELIDRMSTSPAEMYGFMAGTVASGMPADLVIFDPEEVWTVDKENFKSKSQNTPFHGQKLTGKVKYTICRGKVVYQD